MRTLLLSASAAMVIVLSLGATVALAQNTNTNTNTVTVYGGSSTYTPSYPSPITYSYPTYRLNGIVPYAHYPYATTDNVPSTYYSPWYSGSSYQRRSDTFGGCTTYGVYSRYNTRDMGGCDCAAGYAWNAQGTECVPARVGGDLRTLGSGCYLSTGRWSEYWTADCRCFSGSQEGRWSAYRQCVPMQNTYCSAIDANAYYDSARDACLCRGGYRPDRSGRYCIYDTSKPWSAAERELQY